MAQPPKYKDKATLQKKIDKYFKECEIKYVKDKDGKVLTDKNNNPIIELNPPTITGLALYLGFCSRQSLYDYEKNDKYSYTIKKARLMCENFIEVNLYSNRLPAAAGIFALKNYGWRDTQHIQDDTDRSEYLKELREISENFIKAKNGK